MLMKVINKEEVHAYDEDDCADDNSATHHASRRAL